MIDIHCHLLPNIDDGSRSTEDSINTLKQMALGGITHVFLTSHYFRGHYQYPRAEYDAKFNTLCQEVKHQGIDIELLPGFEVFLQAGIEDDVVNNHLCLADTPYVLVESELNGLPPDFYEHIFKLLRKGYKPILAHAERYVSIMKRPEKLDTLIERNLLLQVNAGSLLGLYGEGVQKAAWKMVDNGWVHFMGSDDHVRGSYKAFFDAKSALHENYDDFTANLLCLSNAQKILNGSTITPKYLVASPQVRHRSKPKRSLFSKLFG